MSIEDNMKIVTGLRRMGVMAGEVPQVEAMLAEGKTVKEVADHFACDESVIEAFAKPVQMELKELGNAEAAYKAAEEDEEEEKPRGKRK